MSKIIDIFTELTRKTYPWGTEKELIGLMPDCLRSDFMGNLYTEIGSGNRVMFASHLDTASKEKTLVNQIKDGNFIKTDGRSILGGDDKAGVSLMIWMIMNKVPGHYFFFVGEEVGCKGSKYLSNQHKIKKLSNIDKVISFDRRGTGSVVTHQSRLRTCSDNFARHLSRELNKFGLGFSPDTGGFNTDSAQFSTIYPECTNISVGYNLEHTFSEYQDILHLKKLSKAVLNIDFNNLVSSRDPSKYDWLNYYNYSPNDYTSPVVSPITQQKKLTTIPFYDNIYSFSSKAVVDTLSQEVEEISIAPDRLEFEKKQINCLLELLGMSSREYEWDGISLGVEDVQKSQVQIMSRRKLAEFIPELDFWKEYSNIYD